MNTKSILLILLTICLPLAGAEKPPTEKQIAEVKARAEKGDAKAQGLLAEEYTYGKNKNPDLAYVWATKAAAQGDTTGEFILGRSYHLGLGVEKSYENALKWYHESAKKNYPKAQLNLGVGTLLELGLSIWLGKEIID